MMLKNRWANLQPALILCAVAILILWTLSALPIDVFQSSDEGNKFIQAQNLSLYNTPDLQYPAKSLDPDYRFFPHGGNHFFRLKGKIYSLYPFYFPLLASYFYSAFGTAGIYVLPVAFTIITLLLFHFLMRHFHFDRSTMAMMILVFATPLFFYTLGFWEHSLALALTTAAFLLIVKGEARSSILSVFAAGLLLGISTFLREEGYILFIAIVLGWFLCGYRKKVLAFFACGWLSMMTVQWILNFRLFDHILGLHALYYNPGTFHLILRPGLKAWTALLSNFYVYLFEFDANPLRRFLIALPYLLAIGAGILSYRKQIRSLNVLILVMVVGVSCLSIWSLVSNPDPLRHLLYTQGLFPALPFAVLALVLAGYCFTLSPDFKFLVAVSFLFVIGVCLNLNQQYFGLLWGPRMFFPIFPVLVLLSLKSRESIIMSSNLRSGALMKGMITGILLLGMFMQAHAVYTLYRARNAGHQALDAVRKSPGEVLITDVFWIPESLASVFFEKKIMVVRSDRDLDDLIQILRSKNIRSFTFVAARNFRVLSQEGAGKIRKMAWKGELISTPGMEYVDLMVLSCRL